MPRHAPSPLDSCLGSLRAANHAINQAQTQLNATVSDFARLSRVLNNERCFELVTVSEIKSAQYALQSDIEPSVKQLISQVEQGLAGMEQQAEARRAKAAQAQAQASHKARIKQLQDELAQIRKDKAALLAESDALAHQVAQEREASP